MDFLHFLAEHRSAFGNVFFQSVTYLAQELVVILFICWFFWCGRKTLAYKLSLGYFISGLGIQAMKITFRILRPWVIDPKFTPVESAVSGASGYSFPSGHTQSATAFLGTLGLNTKKTRYRILCAAGILLVAFSRMYLGVHTPKDVFAAMAIAFLACCLISLLFRKIEKNTAFDLPIALLLAAACVALIAYDIHLVNGQIIPASEGGDAIKAAGAGLAFAIGFFVERRFIRLTPPLTTSDKIIRFVIGISVVAGIEFGMKAIFKELLVWEAIRYFLIVLWIMVIYPALIMAIEHFDK